MQPLEISRRAVLMGKRDIDQIGRRKYCRFTKKSPRAIGRGDFVRQSGSYFKTIAVNG